MKVALRQHVFEAVEWHPEMDGGVPKWGLAAHGIHQASNNMGAMGLLSLGGQPQHVHPGDILIIGPNEAVIEVLKPGAFHEKYEEVIEEPAAQIVHAFGLPEGHAGTFIEEDKENQ